MSKRENTVQKKSEECRRECRALWMNKWNRTKNNREDHPVLVKHMRRIQLELIYSEYRLYVDCFMLLLTLVYKVYEAFEINFKITDSILISIARFTILI